MPLLAETITPFDWQRIFWTADAPPSYLLEVLFRCVVTYVLVLGALRVTGRRGVRQLSIFELSIILGLGTAAGDTMLYHDTPLLPVVLVFAVVSLLYWFFNRLTEWYPRFSDWLEGTPVLLIENGRVNIKNLTSVNVTQKELFAELRMQQVEHLGQVRRAYMEATGNLSAYFFTADETAPGLPIWPELLASSQHRVETTGAHACCKCGEVQELARGQANDSNSETGVQEGVVQVGALERGHAAILARLAVEDEVDSQQCSADEAGAHEQTLADIALRDGVGGPGGLLIAAAEGRAEDGLGLGDGGRCLRGEEALLLLQWRLVEAADGEGNGLRGPRRLSQGRRNGKGPPKHKGHCGCVRDW